jgi:DNA-binding NtrC family response regulator
MNSRPLGNFTNDRNNISDVRKLGLTSADTTCDVILLSERTERGFDDLRDELQEDGISVHHCRGIKETRDLLQSRNATALLYDAYLTDRISNIMEHKIGRLLADHPHLRMVALIPAFSAITPNLRAMLRQGWLYDVHSMPYDRLRLVHTLRHIMGLSALEIESTRAEDHVARGFGHLIGTSPAMQRIYSTIRRVRRINIPVLITGESGTGKELIARTLHDRPDRKNDSLVAINCGALPPSLIQSELFGHEPGAFTGAQRRKKGLIEAAHNGTLFLDEIGDMPLEVQPNLLRFLQDGAFKRVGGQETLRVNTRIVAATHIDLYQAMDEGRFREDLFYRLNGVTICVPPLRERGADVEMLAYHFLHRFEKEYARPRITFSEDALTALHKHHWPGNVRELMSAIGRAVALAPRNIVRAADLGLEQEMEAPGSPLPLSKARKDSDRSVILECLQRNRFNIQQSSRELGISRVSLYRLMRKHGIKRPKRRGNDHDA